MNDLDILMRKARKASQYAYSPYSQHKIGSAVLCEDNDIITGCNIENKSYSLTVCAERVALLKALSSGKVAVHLAISGLINGCWVTPCGACRQVISELLSPNGLILIDGIGTRTIEQLLPEQF